jgi:hypothetical protein
MIHDLLIEPPRGSRATAAWRRLWPLADFEFRTLFRSRWGVAMFLLCLFPGLGRLVMLLIVFGVIDFGPAGLRARLRNRGEIATLDPWRVDFYLEPVLSVMPGMVFTLLLTSLVVARTIARDRMANALELYWTRGVTPLGYLLAKGAGCLAVVGLVTVAVPLSLWAVAIFLAEDWSLLTDSGGTMVLAILGLLGVTLAWTASCLAISAICSSPNAAMVAWCMLLIGSSAVGLVVSNALREPWLRSCLSFWDAGAVLVRAIAGVPQRGVSVSGAAATLTLVVVTLLGLARLRLRLREVVR